MDRLNLPPWLLSARLDNGMFEFSLGDGRRLAWHARIPAVVLESPAMALTAEALLGVELAGRLAGSAPRPLGVLYDGAGPLDAVDWEHLALGSARLADQHALGRQLLSDTDATPALATPLAETLRTVVIHAGAVRACPAAPRIALASLDQAEARDALAQAHVLVLDGVLLPQLLERSGWLQHPHLLVMAGTESIERLSAVLDNGAAVCCLAHRSDLIGDATTTLLQQLGGGLSVGESLRWLHRRNAPQRFGARLYGDPELRFVCPPTPTSRRQVTSLSFDMVGSTSLLAALGDEAYAETLAQVHARSTEVVRRHGGQPDDPQGDDGVMGYFGHPSAIEDAAVRAVEAGLAIIQSVATLGIAVRVGIATGLVAVKGGQPVGLSIHLAARLQQAAAPGTVLASETTRRLVANAFDLKLLAQRPPLKGIEVPEPIYVVLGRQSEPQRQPLQVTPLHMPMVGRQAELERLHACWRATHAGSSLLAVVSAEAGLGKSRLVREFRHQLVRRRVKVLECRCRAEANASPFLTLAEALRRWLDIGPDDAPADARRKLAAAVPGHVRADETFVLLAGLLGIAQHPPVAAPSGVRQRLLGMLVDWLRAFARDSVCCLIIEDWHWVDPSMRDFVEHLLARPGGPGLLMVITARTGTTTPLQLAASPHDHIELGGLRPDAARALVAQVCSARPLPPRLLTMLAARGDGVPLFLEEAARMALELGVDGAEAEQRALEAVPASLLDLLTIRLDALGAARLVAQVAAVLGRQFSRALLAALLDAAGHALSDAALDERLAALVGSGLVHPEDEGWFGFRHALIRDAAYASLWMRDRLKLHARVVTLLQEGWPELAARQPELLALHLSEAGLYSQALAQWELAARDAAARSAELEAISHLHRALAVLQRTDANLQRDRTALRLQLLLAARLIATDGYGADAVLQAYREAQRLCQRIGDDDTARFKVEMGLEAYHFMRADFGLALEHGRRAAAIALRSGDTRQRLQAHWGLACTLFHQGELRATMREMDTALALYTPAMHPQFGIQDPGLMCMAYSSWGLWELGRPDAALARINHAVALATEFGHRFGQAVTLAYAVSIELLRGEGAAALARADACAKICEDNGFPVWLAITHCMRGYLLCEQGRFDDGLAEMRKGHAHWLATGAVVSQPLYLALQVEGLILAGQFDMATARVDEGLAISERYGERQLEAELMRLRGELALQRGDAAAGEVWLRRAYAVALRQRRLGFALRSATALARHWSGSGQRQRARRLLAPLAARWSEGHETRDVQRATSLLDSLR